jgi:predicted RNA-binding protein with PUA-like domain
MKYWLMKSEPSVYSIDDLKKEGTTMWDGVRNYQARNFMMKDMKVGDKVLFYHSNADPPGIAGIAQVSKESYPDPTQFDPSSKYFDQKSSKENPRWFLVDIAFVSKFDTLIPLETLKSDPELHDMMVVQKGQRLSVQPVTKEEFDYITKNLL